jgi:hypothetical protein
MYYFAPPVHMLLAYQPREESIDNHVTIQKRKIRKPPQSVHTHGAGGRLLLPVPWCSSTQTNRTNLMYRLLVQLFCAWFGSKLRGGI